MSLFATIVILRKNSTNYVVTKYLKKNSHFQLSVVVSPY